MDISLRTQTPVPFFLNMLGLSEESNRQESNPHSINDNNRPRMVHRCAQEGRYW